MEKLGGGVEQQMGDAGGNKERIKRAYLVIGSKKGDTLLQSAQNRKGGLHTTARPSLSG